MRAALGHQESANGSVEQLGGINHLQSKNKTFGLRKESQVALEWFMENHAFPKPFNEFVCALGFCQAPCLRAQSAGLTKT